MSHDDSIVLMFWAAMCFVILVFAFRDMTRP
jgi:uncharacterized membrane protein YjfL (UPF0719 family)